MATFACPRPSRQEARACKWGYATQCNSSLAVALALEVPALWAARGRLVTSVSPGADFAGSFLSGPFRLSCYNLG